MCFSTQRVKIFCEKLQAILLMQPSPYKDITSKLLLSGNLRFQILTFTSSNSLRNLELDLHCANHLYTDRQSNQVNDRLTIYMNLVLK